MRRPAVADISLFLVPKRLDDGHVNGVRCDGLEHKMGIKGSATCSLTFEAAQGWLIGEANRGLAAMFADDEFGAPTRGPARPGACRGGVAEAPANTPPTVCRCALRSGLKKLAAQAADPIRYHPAMRRVLLELRTTSEGMRAIGYWAAQPAGSGRPIGAVADPYHQGVFH